MSGRRPNILFVIADDQRFDTIGALGASALLTPNLDRLVARGTAFTRAHIPGGTVDAVCMPSRAMVHSGRGLFHLREAGRRVPDNHTLLGEHLSAHGYRSWATGKWHNGTAAFARSFQEGAEIFFGGMSDHWNVPLCDYDPSGRYAARLPVVRSYRSSNRVLWRRGDHVHPGRHSSEIFCDAAVEFLKGYDRSRPFFLYLALMAPHDPRTMPASYRGLYDPARIELPPNYVPEHPFDNGEMRVRDELLAARPRTPEEVRRHIGEYYAMISHLDAELGRVLAELEWQGLAGETIVVFTADHGLAVGQHGLMGKQNLYQHSVRVPLVLAGPGVPQGALRETGCYHFDLFPTLCELTGLPVPASVEGRSLVPALRDPAAAGRERLYFAYGGVQRAVEEGGLKLIEYVSAGGRATQLFDLERDPWERENLADRSGDRATVERLRAALAAERDGWDDRATPWGAAFWDGYERGGWGGGPAPAGEDRR